MALDWKFLGFITRNPNLLTGIVRIYLFYFEVEFIIMSILLICVFLVCFRAECEHNPVQYFVIVSMQRSGSGWFETLLNSHSNVSSNGEIFSVVDRRRNVSSIIETLDKIYNLDWFTSAAKNECSAAVGLKWMLNQVWFKVVFFKHCVVDNFFGCWLLEMTIVAWYHYQPSNHLNNLRCVIVFRLVNTDNTDSGWIMIG